MLCEVSRGSFSLILLDLSLSMLSSVLLLFQCEHKIPVLEIQIGDFSFKSKLVLNSFQLFILNLIKFN